MASPQRSSKTSAPKAPNPNLPKISEAFKAMENLGISKEIVKPVLQNLFDLYDGNWELIEADNYQTLADAIFDSFDDKNNSEPVMVLDEEKSPPKKSHSRENGNKKTEVNSNSDSTKSESIPSSSHLTKVQKKRLQKNSEYDEDVKPINSSGKKLFNKIQDITKGMEKMKISLIDEVGIEKVPTFGYISQNTIYQDAYVPFTLARISDDGCCIRCKGDCLSLRVPCACSRETGGEFAYTKEGLLKDEFLEACISMQIAPENQHFFYCQDCPMEKGKNVKNPEPCKGHLLKKFIKECWRKCGCSWECGNRVVQRGITCKLQVFAIEGKGWGLRTLEDLPKGSFVCEYVGEILTNTELYERNKQSRSNGRHTYPIYLDSDWGSEQVLKDEEALCLDATFYGNAARFINHRCYDSNLIEIPVEVETPDHHYYHIAFFTSKDVEAYQELTWDYQIDFMDEGHPIKAFSCKCGSLYCRDARSKGSKGKEVGVKRHKSI